MVLKTLRLIICIASMPPAGRVAPNDFMTKSEKARNTPATNALAKTASEHTNKNKLEIMTHFFYGLNNIAVWRISKTR